MNRVVAQAICLAFVLLAAVACGSAAPSAGLSLPPATFEQSQTAFCDSLGSLLRAVGNPDAGTPSQLSMALDDAVAAKDSLAADRAASTVRAELETGRRQAAEAARWQPAGPMAAAMDRVLRTFEVYVAAKQARAASAGAPDPQKAFEKAGGLEAWGEMIASVRVNPIPVGASPVPCRAFSGTP